MRHDGDSDPAGDRDHREPHGERQMHECAAQVAQPRKDSWGGGMMMAEQTHDTHGLAANASLPVRVSGARTATALGPACVMTVYRGGAVEAVQVRFSSANLRLSGRMRVMSARPRRR